MGAWRQMIAGLDLEQTFVNTSATGWLIVLVGVALGIAGGKVVQGILRTIAQRLQTRQWALRGALIVDIASPARLLILTMGLHFGLAHVVMSAPTRLISHRGLALLYVLVMAWVAYNLVDLVELGIRRITEQSRSKLDLMLIPLIRKTLRVFVVIVFALFVAGNIFGADITAWLAGLGIAGLAVSLAAQDSIKNIFGSITVFLDRPFSIGDRIVFDVHDGAVEEIGLRSTRLRTLEGELVTIPNSKFVDGVVKNVGQRPHIRRILNVTVTYDTPPEKVELAVTLIRELLAEPDIACGFDLAQNPPRVAFDNFNADSLNIKVFYWFTPADYWQYLEHAQRFNLRLLQRLNDAGIDMAFPTQTLHIPKNALPTRVPEGSVKS